MKKSFFLLMILALNINSFPQAPQKMSYQAVIRNNAGQLVTNHMVGIRITILQGSPSGSPVYAETHTQTSNANGLVTLEIGGGNPVSGTFPGIDWSAGVYFLKLDTDPDGSTNYSITGTHPLLSVPFALYSKTAGNGSLWTKSGSNIYYNNGNIGAGTINPATYIHVHGIPVASRGQFSLSSPAGRDIFFSFYESDIFKAYLWYNVTDQDLRLQNYTAGDLTLNPYGGKVGIGTNTPDELLTVNGNTKVTGNIIPGGKIISQGNITVESSGNKVIIIAGTNKITIDPSGGVTIESNSITVAAAGNLTLSGDNVQINGNTVGITANSALTAEGKGQANIKGSAVNVTGSGLTKIQGGLVTIN